LQFGCAWGPENEVKVKGIVVVGAMSIILKEEYAGFV
jgi:hypothetical protein